MFPRATLSSLSHSIDAGLGIEPSISWVDVGGVDIGLSLQFRAFMMSEM